MNKQPLVTVLLCSHPSRPNEWLQTALSCYRDQTWSSKELVAIDYANGNLATKRNIGVQESRGDYIIHFDDDDWSSPNRIEDQMSVLLRAPDSCDVTSYCRSMWWDRVAKRASFYSYGWGWGATLCYKRSYAIEHPWDESVDTSEDVPFLQPAYDSGRIILTDAGHNFVATQHQLSASRDLTKTPFALIGTDELPLSFRKALNISV